MHALWAQKEDALTPIISVWQRNRVLQCGNEQRIPRRT